MIVESSSSSSLDFLLGLPLRFLFDGLCLLLGEYNGDDGDIIIISSLCRGIVNVGGGNVTIPPSFLFVLSSSPPSSILLPIPLPSDSKLVFLFVNFKYLIVSILTCSLSAITIDDLIPRIMSSSNSVIVVAAAAAVVIVDVVGVVLFV